MARGDARDVDRQLRRMLRDFGERVIDDDVRGIMDEVGDFAEAKMVEITPEDTGFLAGSSVVAVSEAGAVTRAEITFNASYAAQVHELPAEARGPRTRAKRGNEYGEAGPKFVERVLRAFPLDRLVGEGLIRVWARRARGRR